ncbi:MFS transporter [Nocardioides litoris]|uniref:MFS transporter n=1 Tax=Nocardioides litoris TaxID=1926648 RepID=UPI001FE4CCA0|nr:MFS transporter [Nocardioides litoris]
MSDDHPARRRGGQVLVLLGVVTLALNLRPAAVAIGPVLSELRSDLGMSGAEAGLLTSLPVIAFAVLGSLGSRLAALVGPHRLAVLALVAVTAGQVGRTRVDGVAPFLALSLLALGGMAVANVLMPSLVRRHFPDRVSTMTAVYSTALAVGLTAASVLTVPVSTAGDGWRTGLLLWAALGAVALVPWLGLLRRDHGARGSDDEQGAIPARLVARTRTGRLLAGLFGLQSLQAYAVFGWVAEVFGDRGFSDRDAGLLLGVVTGISIPLSALVPWLAGRLRDLTPLVLALAACYPVGYLGLALAPDDLGVGWAVALALVIGTGLCTFPLVLSLIGLRARTPEGTASLSAFVQGTGYLLAAIGPFGVGVLHDATGGWTVPLVALTLAAVPLVLCGLGLARPTYVEDEVERVMKVDSGSGR